LSTRAGHFFLFDLLHLDGKAVDTSPLEELKERFRTLLSQLSLTRAQPLQYNNH
jgi:ATP-dependent DNA ligase